jgi:ClpP class serine protease
MSKKSPRPQPLRPQVGTVPPQNSAITTQTITSQLNIADATPLITAIEKKRGSRVICLTYNDQPPGACQIAFAVATALQQALSEMGKVPKLDLILRTTGGAAELPWRIVSLLREFSDELGVIVSGFALSGGCHIAIAADDLVMGPFSMLGPVDPTRTILYFQKMPRASQFQLLSRI